MTLSVVDENVLIVANDLTLKSVGMAPRCPDASDECGLRCASLLTDLISTGGVCLDFGSEVFDKYRAHCSFAGQPGVGDAFLRAVFERGYVGTWAKRIEVRANGKIRLPDDFLSSGFDNDDHLWVALAFNADEPVHIVNAVDSDYEIFADELLAIGVRVNEVCR